VRFGDFLKATVLLSAGTATLLAALTVIGLSRDDDRTLLVFSAVWWIGAVLVGIWLGRRADASPPIARLLASARAQTMLPELRPGTTIVNRLWPLLLYAVVFSVLGVFRPPVAAVAAGGALIWALAWRRQERAVLAIEQRDGARFYVDRTSPIQPIRLVRTPGFGGAFLRQPL
jgi:hydrogenase-4 membrane subunit HyfE